MGLVQWFYLAFLLSGVIVIPYNVSLRDAARELRNEATEWENMLWYQFLKDFRPRFTRQRIVGSFILDFYCAQAKLAIEADGIQHYITDNLEHDAERTAVLNANGIEVLRFKNSEIKNEFKKVCETIKGKVTERLI